MRLKAEPSWARRLPVWKARLSCGREVGWVQGSPEPYLSSLYKLGPIIEDHSLSSSCDLRL